jgi:hypothetical protein
MIIPTFPAIATWARHTLGPARRYLHTRYGWGSLGDNGEALGGVSDDSEMAKFRKRILPNGKTYSQSDTMSSVAQHEHKHEHMSSENALVAKHRL